MYIDKLNRSIHVFDSLENRKGGTSAINSVDRILEIRRPLNLDLDYKSEIGAAIANFDETNTVKLSEMTPTEIDNLYAKLFNKLIKSNMYEIIKNISYDFPSLY